MTHGSKIVMSFQGHWNGKFPFIPPSAFPRAALQAGWRHHHGTATFAWMHMAASYKSRGFTCIRPPRSSPSQSTAVAISWTVCDARRRHLHVPMGSPS